MRHKWCISVVQFKMGLRDNQIVSIHNQIVKKQIDPSSEMP